jgi:hypothetical protein
MEKSLSEDFRDYRLETDPIFLNAKIDIADYTTNEEKVKNSFIDIELPEETFLSKSVEELNLEDVSAEQKTRNLEGMQDSGNKINQVQKELNELKKVVEKEVIPSIDNVSAATSDKFRGHSSKKFTEERPTVQQYNLYFNSKSKSLSSYPIWV